MTEGEKEEQEIENLFEKIMKENFSNLVKEIHIEIQEAQRVPNNLDPKKTTPRYIINKIFKNKKEKRIQKNDDSVSSLWDNIKRSNICIIVVPEREEKEKEIGNLFEKIRKENFLNLVRK